MKKKIVCGLLVVFMAITFVGCASWQRNIKDAQSDLGGGLNRTITVYSYDAKKIETFTGKIDLDLSKTGIVKFELNGKRHQIVNAIVDISEQ